MDSSTSTPSATPEGNNDASKTTRTAIIFIVVAIVLIVAIAFCAFWLHRVNDRLVQAEERIEILTTTSGPIPCWDITNDQVRLMTIDAAQREYDAYIDSQSNLLTIFTILITVMVALLGMGAPYLINKEQGDANKKELGEAVKKQEEELKNKEEELKNKIDAEIKTQEEGLKERLNTETEGKIKEAKKQIDEKITEIGTEAKSKSDKMGVEMESAKKRIEKIERDVTGIIEDLRKRQENFDKNREIESKSPDEQVKEWKKMEEEGRADSDTYFKLGKHYFDNNDYGKANDYFGKAVKNRDNYAEVYPLWAEALEKQGQLAKAWEKREKAIILNPNDQDLKNTQAKLVSILTSDSSLQETETIEVGGVKFDMKLVRKGAFTMGATPEQGKESFVYEKPAHRVLLNDYYIGDTAVTQALWNAVMGENPSFFKGDSRPVECVSWDDVTQRFIPELNRRTGRKFRLPTEAEWEYAARGGNKSKGYKYSGSDDIDEVAWYDGNSNDETHPVKGKKPNELGLYDMSGNVREWCQDEYRDYSGDPQVNPERDIEDKVGGLHRICRGGGWYFDAWYSRVAHRTFIIHDHSNRILGFRLALDASLPQEEVNKA